MIVSQLTVLENYGKCKVPWDLGLQTVAAATIATRYQVKIGSSLPEI